MRVPEIEYMITQISAYLFKHCCKISINFRCMKYIMCKVSFHSEHNGTKEVRLEDTE